MAKNANTKPLPPAPPRAPVQAAPSAPVKERPAVPSHAQIAARAYELFLARGGEHGRHDEDWKQAERELQLGRQ